MSGEIIMSFRKSTDRAIAADRRKPSATARKPPWHDETKPEMIERFRRRQLIDLLRDRNELQDNELGRRNLVLLFQLGLTYLEAQSLAPWSHSEIDTLFVKADSSLNSWNAASLGNAIELTFEEKIRLNIRNIECFDKPRHLVQAFYLDRRRKRDAERKRRYRAQERQRREEGIDRLSRRAVAVLDVSDYQIWRSTQEITSRLAQNRVFANLGGSAMRQALSRAFRELLTAGLIEERFDRLYEANTLGYVTRLVRRIRSKRREDVLMSQHTGARTSAVTPTISL